jgi:hypothetical protein
MKQNTWKILTIIMVIIVLVEFIWAYSYINNQEILSFKKYKDLETSTTIKIKELEMRIQQDSMKLNECQKIKRVKVASDY